MVRDTYREHFLTFFILLIYFFRSVSLLHPISLNLFLVYYSHLLLSSPTPISSSHPNSHPLFSSPTFFSTLVSIISGVVGDSNTLCHNSTSPIIGLTGAIGSTCTTGTNCLYGLCLNNICTAPALTCPTNTTGVFTKDFNRIQVIISEVFG